MDKLKNPPLIKTTCNIYFDNNLKIFENKSAFYETIKSAFPKIIYPDNKNLKFPMGDVNFYTPTFDKVLQVNSNLLSLADTKYHDFKTFKKILNEHIERFAKVYGIEKFNSFNLVYENTVVLKKEIGEKFGDYFTVEFNFKGKKEKTFLGTVGNFVFAVKEGLLIVEIAPEVSPTQITEKYKFSISFISSFASSVTLKYLQDSLEAGHDFIDDIFETSLTQNYIKTLK